MRLSIGSVILGFYFIREGHWRVERGNHGQWFAQGHTERRAKNPAHPKLVPSKFEFHLSGSWSLSSHSCCSSPHLSQLRLTLSFFPFYLPEFCPENFAGYLVSSEIPSQSGCSINLPVSVTLRLLIYCHQSIDGNYKVEQERRKEKSNKHIIN